VGRDVGTAEGYNYSGALSEAADVWTPENLRAFLENPAGYAPGTSMGYSGLKDVEDRANLIAYLDSIDGRSPLATVIGPLSRLGGRPFHAPWMDRDRTCGDDAQAADLFTGLNVASPLL
jgi:hypothetical protein